MDSDTWNAYHIVSNRARAVCYASRQQLFRRRAAQTVNMLIASAASQLSAMEDLKVLHTVHLFFFKFFFYWSASIFCQSVIICAEADGSKRFFFFFLDPHVVFL